MGKPVHSLLPHFIHSSDSPSPSPLSNKPRQMRRSQRLSLPPRTQSARHTQKDEKGGGKEQERRRLGELSSQPISPCLRKGYLMRFLLLLLSPHLSHNVFPLPSYVLFFVSLLRSTLFHFLPYTTPLGSPLSPFPPPPLSHRSHQSCYNL